MVKRGYSTVSARVTHEQHRQIRDFCRQFNCNMQDLLAEMILHCIENVPLEVETVKVFALGGKRRVVEEGTGVVRGVPPKCETKE